MAIADAARDLCERCPSLRDDELARTDPEFAELFASFAYGEVVGEPAAALPDRERFLVVLAALLGCQGIDEFRIMAAAALEAGLEPLEIKELVYQATAYLGIGRVRPFLAVANEVLQSCGVGLPLPAQGTTTPETRLSAGNQKQVDYFGEGIRKSWETGAPERSHINRWLADNCFGDYYTRGGLSDRDRELATFCYIAAQGGCEPQLTAHAAGNMNLGNDRDLLYRAVSQMVPYIGYPRSLNALTCVDKAAAQRAD